MNIKQHIEAGHYPTDEKGRALVPVKSEFNPANGAAWTATICATDGPHGSIIGFGPSSVREWGDDGTPFHTEGRLLPPPSRNRPIKRYLIQRPDGSLSGYVLKTFADTLSFTKERGGWRAIELTGEYDPKGDDNA